MDGDNILMLWEPNQKVNIHSKYKDNFIPQYNIFFLFKNIVQYKAFWFITEMFLLFFY